jgi:RimJ/RimL family protein N-acetyltransferase
MLMPSPPELDAGEGLRLTAFREGDAGPLVALLADRGIHDQTLRIPFPYTDADARAWIELANAPGPWLLWALRQDGVRAGALGLDLGDEHAASAELGYWLGAAWRGKGRMTRAVRSALGHAFGPLGLRRVTAHVFAGNRESAALLERCGFLFETALPDFHEKDGRKLDAWRYSRSSSESS